MNEMEEGEDGRWESVMYEKKDNDEEKLQTVVQFVHKYTIFNRRHRQDITVDAEKV